MVIRKEKLDFLRLEDIDSTSSGIVIMPIAQFLHARGNQNTLHSRSFFSLLLLTRGNLLMVADKTIYTVEPNEMISLNSNCVCSFQHNVSVEGCVILFTEAFLMQRYNTDTLQHFNFLKVNAIKGYVLTEDEIYRCRNLVKLMQEEFKSLRMGSKGVLRNYLSILLQILGRNMANDSVYAQMDEKEEKISLFESLVNENYKVSRFPSFYADRLNISVNYLNRICREKRSASCGSIIRDRILLEAERLLFHTFKTVKEIAFELGFDNVPYFITFFKAKKGVSPEEFRRNQ
ncbi:helix-turn-helix domain-containing protein [Sphingobacterium sp.]|uniref:helix-turn-helix transcriptional regulator n=1 Tax=Sphingobacterium sp. TaxID=341027 RepID=UPI00289658B4|nr:helix-turn-helix domain-containing protein [Sphingobacterium sp.]